MGNTIKNFVKKHTPAGRYFARVEVGIDMQKERLKELDDPTWTQRLRHVVGVNHVSGKIENLLMGRG
jgi:hypothetical protein